MSAIETVKTVMAALQSGDMELAATLLADDFRLEGLAPQHLSKSQYLAVQSELLAAMPDFTYNLDAVQTNREPETNFHVRAQCTIIGTQKGDLNLPLFGVATIEATGIEIVLPQTSLLYNVEDNVVKKMLFEPQPGGGIAGILQQLGAEIPLAPRERNIPD